jgi:AraC-like DNA-binding protein
MKRKDQQVIQEIRDYLDDNSYTEHTIQEICRRFMINREKLQAGFREFLHTTVHAYIISQRMTRAAKRLLESDDSIKVIALDSGYKKQRSFNKIFKTVFNLTPAAYRRLHQHREESRH